jgi:hypothetical protein
MSIRSKSWGLFRAIEKPLRLPMIILVLIIGGLLLLGQGSEGLIFYSIF